MFKKETLSDDIFASIVVFLVALPLSLGIAIAAGVDPIKSLFTVVNNNGEKRHYMGHLD